MGQGCGCLANILQMLGPGAQRPLRQFCATTVLPVWDLTICFERVAIVQDKKGKAIVGHLGHLPVALGLVTCTEHSQATIEGMLRKFRL